jgi:pimeloyl-ACP methyl ester carboxylesterase
MPIEELALRALPRDVSVRLKTWKTMWNVFLYCHYGFGILGVVASTAAAAMASKHPARAAALAVISASSVAVIGFVAPEKRYLGFVRAWRTLQIASSRYQYGLIPISDLLTIMERCEVVATEPAVHDAQLDELPVSGLLVRGQDDAAGDLLHGAASATIDSKGGA